MPQGSLITFSPGQKQTNSGTAVSTSPETADCPVYDLRSALPLGADQASPGSGTSIPFSQNPLETSSYVEKVSSKIPRGVAMPPSLKLEATGKTARLKTRQLWEGTVTELREEGFVAVLSDKTDKSNPDEQAVFDFTEISPEDHKLIQPGASFYWTIGNEITVGGQVKNVSMVQFRRLPSWPSHRLARVAEIARRLRESLQE